MVTYSVWLSCAAQGGQKGQLSRVVPHGTQERARARDGRQRHASRHAIDGAHIRKGLVQVLGTLPQGFLLQTQLATRCCCVTARVLEEGKATQHLE